jgi:hypothetical protein
MKQILVVATVVIAFLGALVARGQDVALVHPAYNLSVGTVVVTVWAPTRSSRIILSQNVAAVFAVDGCDALTTFDAFADYERLSYDDRIKRKIEVTYGGRVFEGVLRPVGVLPLGLNLACVDINVRSPEGGPTLFPLSLMRAKQRIAIGDENVPLDLKPGTPFVDEKGKVAGMLTCVTRSGPVLLPAESIADFLKIARAFAPVSLAFRAPR